MSRSRDFMDKANAKLLKPYYDRLEAELAAFLKMGYTKDEIVVISHEARFLRPEEQMPRAYPRSMYFDSNLEQG